MSDSPFDVVVLSHLRWDFVYQRPQHLMSRFAHKHRVLFFEEPVFESARPCLNVRRLSDNLTIAVPDLPPGTWRTNAEDLQKDLLDAYFADEAFREYVLWYYTPMSLGFTQHLTPLGSVYDCMDDLSLFNSAPPELKIREAELLSRANLVFTGGQALYEAKQGLHSNLYCFPSGVDHLHFGRARKPIPDPADQAGIPHPRLGFFGVIDERMDTGLLNAIAQARPDWQLIMLGPVVKIDPGSLPQCPNIHYLGHKSYQELPDYIANWDVALLPLAHNDATRFISPTKTAEYLAAGRPVVSTSIRDVVRPYGLEGIVRIAGTYSDFVDAVEVALLDSQGDWLRRADEMIADLSWDRTWEKMDSLLTTAVFPERAGAQAA